MSAHVSLRGCQTSSRSLFGSLPLVSLSVYVRVPLPLHVFASLRTLLLVYAPHLLQHIQGWLALPATQMVWLAVCSGGTMSSWSSASHLRLLSMLTVSSGASAVFARASDWSTPVWLMLRRWHKLYSLVALLHLLCGAVLS